MTFHKSVILFSMHTMAGGMFCPPDRQIIGKANEIYRPISMQVFFIDFF